MENYKMVSLIPARGGSKRVPRKNIKMMAGKPMLAWTIEASLKSRYISRTFVSTEDKEIKEVALQYGAEVIDRPEKYATDTVERRSYEAEGYIWNFKEALWDMRCQPDYLAFLYPTSPLRTSKMIDEAFELMIKRNCTSIMSVYELGTFANNCADYGYYILNGKNKAECVPDCTPKEFYARSLRAGTQEPRYAECPYVYITRYADPYNHRGTNIDFTLYVIDRAKGLTGDIVDVDLPLDFAMAEYLLEERMKKEG